MCWDPTYLCCDLLSVSEYVDLKSTLKSPLSSTEMSMQRAKRREESTKGTSTIRRRTQDQPPPTHTRLLPLNPPTIPPQMTYTPHPNQNPDPSSSPLLKPRPNYPSPKMPTPLDPPPLPNPGPSTPPPKIPTPNPPYTPLTAPPPKKKKKKKKK